MLWDYKDKGGDGQSPPLSGGPGQKFILWALSSFLTVPVKTAEGGAILLHFPLVDAFLTCVWGLEMCPFPCCPFSAFLLKGGRRLEAGASRKLMRVSPPLPCEFSASLSLLTSATATHEMPVPTQVWRRHPQA